ncbi:MAG: hypothetical protein ACXW3D_02470 [Caulobacteraceae bacterium]
MSVLSIAAAAIALATAPAPAASSPCTGTPAQAGAVVTGTVLHVIDGDRLCLASGPTPDQWTELRINTLYQHSVADRDPAYGKAQLMNVSFGKQLTCEVSAKGVAECAADGQKLTDLMAAPGAAQAALKWYKPAARDAVLRIASR